MAYDLDADGESDSFITLMGDGGRGMGVLWYLLVGAAVGIIARILLPGRQRLGWIMTIILGALGAFLAGLLGQWQSWYTFPSWLGFGAAIAVAMILIGIYSGSKRR